MTELTVNQRKYLCAVLAVENEKKAARIKDIAQLLSLGAAAVSESVKNLASKGFLNYEPYGLISLTQKGENAALETLKINKIAEEFFLKIPDITPEEAAKAASDTAALLSKEIIKKIEKFCKQSQ